MLGALLTRISGAGITGSGGCASGSHCSGTGVVATGVSQDLTRYLLNRRKPVPAPITGGGSCTSTSDCAGAGVVSPAPIVEKPRLITGVGQVSSVGLLASGHAVVENPLRKLAKLNERKRRIAALLLAA